MRKAASKLGGARVLVACGDPNFRRHAVRALQEELGLEVESVSDGTRALELLQNRAYRLLVADTELQGILWFDLVQFLRELRPGTRYALSSSTPPDQHFRLAMEYDVGNILPRSAPKPLRDLVETAEALLTENVFGLERWLGAGAQVHGRQLDNPSQIQETVDQVAGWFPDGEMRRTFRRSLSEMLTNAVYYGSLDEDGARKEEWATDVVLQRDQAVYVFFGRAADLWGCSVVDRGGRLTKGQVLSWLEQNRSQGAGGIQLNDQLHGRGLHITRRSLDRVVVNIRRGDRTEAILLRDAAENRPPQRPLLIHEF